MTSRLVLYLGVALIGAALFAIRYISPEFRLGTTTKDHPYLLFTGLLIIANLIWFFFIPLISASVSKGRRRDMRVKNYVWFLLFVSLVFRGFFFGSTPIYEDDWNRYLWDGAVVVQGESPYAHSPAEVIENPELAPLKTYAEDRADRPGGNILKRINNRELTTIYPPVAQSAFAGAALLAPLNLDALRFVYLVIEALTLLLLVRLLPKYGRAPDWALIYAFSPLLIYSAFNAAHMDILLPPLILLTLLFIRFSPVLAGAALSAAAGVKIWPLILAPALFRPYLRRPVIYGFCVLLISGFTVLLLWPMLREIGNDSGLAAYSEHWRRSSFIFPWIEYFADFVTEHPGRLARGFIAVSVTLTALWYGFFSRFVDANDMPARLLIITLVLLLLSPTGFPWYAIWFIVFLPFVPSYGAALLCVLLPLYYVRYALGEAGDYHIYKNVLTPLQFGLPLLVLMVELLSRRRYA